LKRRGRCCSDAGRVAKPAKDLHRIYRPSLTAGFSCAEVAASHFFRESDMPRGDKSSYSGRQKRKAEHIEEGYESRGVGKEEAERRAWATVNKQEGGAKKTGGKKKSKSK